MNNFLRNHKVYLTPVSPIHIGCGEDFEPTNYIMDNNVLYYFDPANLDLSKSEKKELENKFSANVKYADLLWVQSFFLKQKSKAIEMSRYFTNIPNNIQENWKSKLGKVVHKEKEGKDIIAELKIERTAYTSYQNEAYIPASSLKGAFATSILNKKHELAGNPRTNKNDHKDLLERYIGDTKYSLLHYVRFGDFMPSYTTNTKVYYAKNLKKKPKSIEKKFEGISTLRECIIAGQYRALVSELVLQNDEKDNKLMSVKQIISYLNEYYIPIFEEELKYLGENGLSNKAFLVELRKLLSGNVALIRLGKSGADSKIYRGKNLAKIKINKGKGNSEICDRSTTYWLGAEQSKQTTNFLPFGWALLEFDVTEDNKDLQEWCEKYQESVIDKHRILEDKKQKEQERLNELKLKREKEEAEAQEIKREQERILSLSENKQLVEQFIARHQTAEIKSHTDSPVFKEAKDMLAKAFNESWADDEKIYLVEKLNLESGILKDRVHINSDKAKKEFKKLLNKLIPN